MAVQEAVGGLAAEDVASTASIIAEAGTAVGEAAGTEILAEILVYFYYFKLFCVSN